MSSRQNKRSRILNTEFEPATSIQEVVDRTEGEVTYQEVISYGSGLKELPSYKTTLIASAAGGQSALSKLFESETERMNQATETAGVQHHSSFAKTFAAFRMA